MKRLAMLAAIGLVAFPALAAGQYGPRTKWFDEVTLTTKAQKFRCQIEAW